MQLTDDQIENTDWGDFGGVELSPAKHRFDAPWTTAFISIPNVTGQQIQNMAELNIKPYAISSIYLGDNITECTGDFTMANVQTLYGGQNLTTISNSIFLDKEKYDNSQDSVLSINALYLKTMTPPKYRDDLKNTVSYNGALNGQKVSVYVPKGSESNYTAAWQSYIDRGEVVIKSYDINGIFLFNLLPNSGSSPGDGIVNTMEIEVQGSTAALSTDITGIHFGCDITGSAGDALQYLTNEQYQTVYDSGYSSFRYYWADDNVQYRVLEITSGVKEIQKMFTTFKCGIQIF